MDQMSWYTASFGLALGSVILPAGRLGDIFGHKRVFMIGWLWFALWSLICGFSYHGGYNMLVISRAMQGIGPALLVPNGIGLIGRTFPMGMKRNISIACFGGCGPLGFVIGAAFSALCSDRGWWVWPFWALAITCAVVTVLSFYFIPADSHLHHTDSGNKWWKKYDLPGAVTGVGGLVMINFAFNQGPIVGWQEAYVSFILILGLISFSIFIYIELHIASHPLIPIKGLHREAAFTLACIACGWGSHGVWIYYFYILAENFRGYPALTAAAQTSPVAPIGFLCALAVPFILRKGFKVAWVMFMAMAAFLVGTLLLATAPINQSYWINTFLSMVIMPLGMNCSFPAATMLMSNAMPREHQGVAASLVSTMVNYSISTGLGVAGTASRYAAQVQGAEAGWRSALWFALALDVLGLLVSGHFVWKSRARK
jgi:MFS family permease